MPRPQFTLRALLAAMLVVAAFFGGRVVGIENERKRMSAEVSEKKEKLQKEADDLRKNTLHLHGVLSRSIEQHKRIIQIQKESLQKLRLTEDNRVPAS
jgi:hypothetical protein